MCLSEGDKDTAPTICSEEGVGGSSQLHLRTERGLHSPVQGTEGGHVSAQTHSSLTLKDCGSRPTLLVKCHEITVVVNWHYTNKIKLVLT